MAKQQLSFRDYLAEVDSKIRELPRGERQSHINEIKDHLLSEKEEICAQYNCSSNDAERRVLNSYLTAEELSTQILSLYQQEQKEAFNGNHFGFNVSLSLVFAGLGLFSFPIYFSNINANLAGIFTVYGTLFVVACWFTFRYYPKKVDKQKLISLRYTGIAMFFLLFMAFGAYAMHIIKFETVTAFSSIYLLFYLIAWISVYLAFRNLYKTAQKSVDY